MSEREDIDPGLDEFAHAARGRLEDALAANSPRLDLAAVFQRARELDPAFVDEAMLEQAHEIEPIVHDDLAPFAAALRGQFEASLAERRAREIPPPRFLARRSLPHPRRRSMSWAAAAIVLVLIGGVVSAMIGGGDSQLSTDLRAWAMNAVSLVRALESAPRPQPSSEASSPEESPAEASEPEPESEPELAAPSEATSEPSDRPRVRARKRNDSTSSDDSLAELDARAQALWRAGDVDGAEQLFAEIVRRGGRGRWAELAYGELFSLARGQSAERREKLWRDYLASFPKGRYAEDARAGLCRRARDAEADSCWSDYLEHHPEGTHAGEARRALGLDESSP
jgi:hypothetical protein